MTGDMRWGFRRGWDVVVADDDTWWCGGGVAKPGG